MSEIWGIPWLILLVLLWFGLAIAVHIAVVIWEAGFWGTVNRIVKTALTIGIWRLATSAHHREDQVLLPLCGVVGFIVIVNIWQRPETTLKKTESGHRESCGQPQ